jgi:hypothetical protein
LPDGERVEVPEGTLLLEAAAAAGLLIEAECGGKGTCGSCLMEVQSATPDGQPVEGEEPRLLYGCRDRVQQDVLATPLFGAGGKRKRIVTGTSYLLRQKIELDPKELQPIWRKLPLRVPPPSIELCISDRERLTRAACSAANLESVLLDLQVLRGLPDALRQEDGRVTATL